MRLHIVLRRKLYSEIRKWFEEPYKDALVIKGARQAGKTYLVRRYLEESCTSSLEISFVEKPDAKDIFVGNLDVDTLILRMSASFPDFVFTPGKTVLFLDEIQLCPDAWTSLKSFVADGRYRVIASGSLLGMKYKRIISNPVGYARIVDMYPLDFEEFLWALGMDDSMTAELKSYIPEKKPFGKSILDSLDRYYRIFMIVGGMPEVVSRYIETKDLNAVEKVQKKILDLYQLDVAQYAPENEKNRIYACFRSIPFQLSRENKKFVYNQIDSDEFPAYRTYEKALDWMKDGEFVEECCNVSAPQEPLETHVLDNQFKIYLNDSGLLSYMLGPNIARSIMTGDPRVNRGAIAENAVADGLHKCGFELRYFKKDNLEIDFIAVLGSNVSAIEVKSGNNKRAKSLDSVKEKYGIKRRIKFEITDIYVDDRGVEHYPLFASAFADMLAPEPAMDLSYDIEELKNLLDPDRNETGSE